MSGIALAHTECEVHVTVLFFGTSCATRRFREGHIANFESLLVAEAVHRITIVDNCTDLQIELEVHGTLEPRMSGEVLQAWFDALASVRHVVIGHALCFYHWYSFEIFCVVTLIILLKSNHFGYINAINFRTTEFLHCQSQSNT